MHKKYKVEALKTIKQNHLFKVPTGTDALEIANAYQESGLVKYSKPNFYCKKDLNQVIPNDPYFPNQFYLNNTGQSFTDGHSGTINADINAPEAWEMTKGNGNIIVAVIDQGITSDHPDLPNTRQVRLNGSNLGNGDKNDPSPFGNNNHGNACAGIIAATQNNNQGITGIAPNCKIMPICDGPSEESTASAIEFAWKHGAHIISCSWSYRISDPYFSYDIRNEIDSAVIRGRNGLGCIVVFASGNYAEHSQNNNGFIGFPANVDFNDHKILTVGATDRYDMQANYSPTSNPLSHENQIIDIVAPSHRAYSNEIPGETVEVWSIDIPGESGDNPVHETDEGPLPVVGSILPSSGLNYLAYTGRFGGTSCACPEVAAVAALMLSIDPSLTQQEVFNIITSTADKVGGYSYSGGRSNETGYGRLNACRAVLETYKRVASISGPSLVCSSGSTFSLGHLTQDCHITWGCSGNMRLLSPPSGNSATFISVGNGKGSINATLNTGCGDFPVPSKEVWVGSPSNVSVLGNDGMNKGIIGTYTIPEAASQCISTYSWDADGGMSPYGSTTSSSFRARATGCGFGDVYCTASNACGSAFGDLAIEIFCPTPSYAISPNPASTAVTISSNSDAGTARSGQVSSITFDFVRVYDLQGNLIKAYKYAQASSASISTAGLREGSYIFEVGSALRSEKLQVIIKR